MHPQHLELVLYTNIHVFAHLCSKNSKKPAIRHGVRCPIPANQCPSLTTRLQFWHFVSHKINKLIVLTGHFSLDFPASHFSLPKGKYKEKAAKKLSTSLVQCSFKIVFSFLDRPSQFPIPVPHLASRPHPPSV